MMARPSYYEFERLKKDGTTEKVLRCSRCDEDLLRGKWREAKRGILYEVQGWFCPRCGRGKEEAYNLVGNE